MAQTFLRFRQWHMLCVLPLFLLLLAGCTQDVYDMPPTVLINGENYRLANVVYEKLPEGAEYLGELSNCVPPNHPAQGKTSKPTAIWTGTRSIGLTAAASWWSTTGAGSVMASSRNPR